MNGQKLTVVLVYIALTGATGQDNFEERKDHAATNTKMYRSIKVTRDDVDLLFNCFCHNIVAAACHWPTTTSIDTVTDSTMSTIDHSTIKPLSDCHIKIQDLLNCSNDNSSNGTCIIHCYSPIDDNVSVIVIINNSQIVDFVSQNFTEEIQCACNNFFLTTFTPPVPRLEDGTATITTILHSSDAVNTTADYESDELSPGSIAGIVVGVTLGVAALVCIVVKYLLCRRRYLRVKKTVPRPPAKSYLHNESFKQIENSCEHGNIGSFSTKDVEKNSSMTGVYKNQEFRPDNTSAGVDNSDGGDGLVYEDISGLKSMHENPGYLQRTGFAAKNNHNTSEINSTYSNIQENYMALESCLTNDLGQDYVELSSESSVKLPVPNDLKSNQTVPFKPNLGLHRNNADPVVISNMNIFDESLSSNDDNKKESVYFELEKASDDEDDNAECENDTEIYSNI